MDTRQNNNQDNKPLKAYKKNKSGDTSLKVKLTSAGPKGLGFGEVYHTDEMKAFDEEGKQVIERYKNIESAEGRQGMKRQGQDMDDPNRPGLVGKSGIELIPEAFKNTHLLESIKSHELSHGSGVNRWQLHGSYAIDSWDHDFPAAGVHSGGASDILLAFNCMDEKSIFGNKQTMSLGLLISSFMNFGGYHSFIETFPIALAAANNTTFKVAVIKAQQNLYDELAAVARKSSPEASEEIIKYLEAYKAAIKNIFIFTPPKQKELMRASKKQG